MPAITPGIQTKPSDLFLPKCWFDAEKCARGIDALKLYRAHYDDKLQALRPRPVHDWSSHGADSFRYLALTLDRKATHSGFYRRITTVPAQRCLGESGYRLLPFGEPALWPQ